jgi:CubicO group peptidase (beta-lactamase class C family)
MRIRRHITALGLALSLAAVVPAAAGAQAAAVAPVSLETTVDRIAADLIARKESAGFAIGIEQNGIVRLARGYGYANLEDGTRVTEHTVFRIGSVTKQFTAAAILLLAEDGKLSLDDRLAKYLPTFPRGGEVTLRQLLTHTSGIRNYTGYPDFLKGQSPRALTGDEMIAYIAGATPAYDFDPGTGWSYSNSGYLLLGIVVEKGSGQPLAQVLRTRIFEPLGLRDTRLDDLAEIVPGRASGYDKAAASPTGFANAGFIAMEVAAGAGAIRSTVGDLLKWNDALLGGKLLKPASLRMMLEPARLIDGRLASAARAGPAAAAATSEPPSNYGFGITTGEQKGRRTIGHGGSINGFNASLTSYPDQKVTIVVLTNTLPAAGAVTAALVDPVFAALRPTR